MPQDNQSYIDVSWIQTFNGYAPSGNASGQVVYVNYGTQQDFAYLESIGEAKYDFEAFP